MKVKISGILPKQFVGLNIHLNKQKGSAMGILFVGVVATMLILSIFAFCLDYAIYSYRYSTISSALDYAVCGAALEVDQTSTGLKEGFAESNGKFTMENVNINSQKADSAFLSILNENLGVSTQTYVKCLETALITPVVGGLDYEIRIGGVAGNCQKMISGFVAEKDQLEEVLNNAASEMENETISKDAGIFVNGNTSTNEFDDRPYYLAFIRNFEIDGLFTRKYADFSAFKGATIVRRE